LIGLLDETLINFPSQATENWSSPTLLSGEALNFYGVCGNLSFDSIDN